MNRGKLRMWSQFAVLLLSVIQVKPEVFTILKGTNQINVTAGDNAFFSVRPSRQILYQIWTFGSKAVALWLKGSPVVYPFYESRAKLFPSNGSLLLKSVTASDSGEYSVHMLSDMGDEAKATITLNILAQPQGFVIKTESSHIHVTTIGGNAFFSVQPSAEVQSGSWKFGATAIAQWIGTTKMFTTQYRERAEIWLPNGSLQLKSVTASDSGVYTVSMVRRSSSSATASIILHVATQPQGFAIKTEYNLINATVGSNAFLLVWPSAEVKFGSWRFQATAVGHWIETTEVLTNEYRGRAEIFLPNGALLLRSVTASDSGEYTVTMIPKSGTSATATITLYVLDDAQSQTEPPTIAAITMGVLLSVSLILLVVLFTDKKRGCLGAGNSETSSTAHEATSAGAAYENFPSPEDIENRDGKSLDKNSTYMDLKLEDQSIYHDLRK
ncbi:pregnancy-specific glycoprotein 22-like isoform X2 [Heterodontus francisci]|uniref:pregnancy-specific glycoprotein 22-like isoform X2 n=1 Tax=Heterodontus francisci TaxID=7792 RepID=UPI00355C5260